LRRQLCFIWLKIDINLLKYFFCYFSVVHSYMTEIRSEETAFTSTLTAFTSTLMAFTSTLTAFTGTLRVFTSTLTASSALTQSLLKLSPQNSKTLRDLSKINKFADSYGLHKHSYGSFKALLMACTKRKTLLFFRKKF
jgi:hypothetical protein